MIISLIAAVGANWVIGKGGELPWRLPADLRRFKSTTLGKPVVMGRKTYESIGHPLSDRLNIVITTNRSYQAPGCIVVHSIDQALSAAQGNDEIMIIGGAAIYQHFIAFADRIYLTEIDESFEGDVYFPEVNLEEWQEVSRESVSKDKDRPYGYHFVIYERLRNAGVDQMEERGSS
ncbi:MAG: dihydrofolate reductase [Anaerolineae bacterium]|nr:MAG: dihydrofolate reductase [Anaerolineae bacterium]